MASRLLSKASLASLASIASSVPSIVIHPPLEEAFSEPCLSYAPDETIKPLANPAASNPISAINALLQLFVALPEINQELPLTSPDPSVAAFASLVHILHLEPDTHLEPAEIIAHIDSWLPHASLALDNPSSVPTDFEQIPHRLLQSVLLKTRFGRRFDFALTDSSDAPSRSAHPSPLSQHAADADTGPRSDMDADIDGTDSDPALHAILRLDTSGYGTSETVPLLTLLNKRFGHSPATLFFGGSIGEPPSVASNAAAASPGSAVAAASFANKPLSHFTTKPAIQFAVLPHFLLLSIDRPLLDPPTSEARYHNPAVELPLEVDLGFFYDPTAQVPLQQFVAPGASGRGRRASSSSGGRAPTFYRLHGFVTQANGHFLTYTRIRGGGTWFKCDDGDVGLMDLGQRVASKGIMLALYRLQD
ncbi:hypothetical protein BC831DRAFT_446776 [Entophlyctis helioformis]|nr:hypothetical protein BC831DRAFT_446776 [Entophlyctis helioformis]